MTTKWCGHAYCGRHRQCVTECWAEGVGGCKAVDVCSKTRDHVKGSEPAEPEGLPAPIPLPESTSVRAEFLHFLSEKLYEDITDVSFYGEKEIQDKKKTGSPIAWIDSFSITALSDGAYVREWTNMQAADLLNEFFKE